MTLSTLNYQNAMTLFDWDTASVIAIIMILPIYHQVRLDWIMSGGGGLAAYTLAILVGSFVYMMWSAYGADIYDKKKDLLESIRNPIIVFLVFPLFLLQIAENLRKLLLILGFCLGFPLYFIIYYHS